MKILVVSDTHGRASYLMEAVDTEKPDAVIHLGDGYKDLRGLGLMYPDIGVYSVGGNCDFSVELPKYLVFVTHGVKIFMTHGHTYRVKSSLWELIRAAKSQKADVVLYGHTHTADMEEREGMTVINPGSLGYSGSYGILAVNNGRFSYERRSI
ncbi:MAG: metallophosphoesterase [Oscillospiraceae bacterium]|nr:metallophosphoesterase [Oscillospiraceae bacterium]